MTRILRTALLAAAVLASGCASSASDIHRTSVRMDILSSTAYYKARFQRPFYATCSFRFDDVQEVEDFDMKPFRRAIFEAVGEPQAGSPEQVMSAWTRMLLQTYPDTFDEVPQPGRSAKYADWYDTHAEDEDDCFPYDAPYENASLEYADYNPAARVISMTYTRTTNTGGGTGGSYAQKRQTLYFDFQRQRMIGLADLFNGNYRAALLQNVHQWLEDNSDALCLLADIPDVALSNLWEISDGAIVFTYPKYEISCGAGGDLHVPVYTYDLQSLLTPLGRKLLNADF